MKVTIYVLIDPNTLKVRYIGRTTTSLSQRLHTHLSKARNHYTNTHKDNWLRLLMLSNSIPIIRKLIQIDGWKESHKIERELINKYHSRLLNHEDRGEGSKNHIVSESTKKLISESLKKQFRENGLFNSARKEIYVYDLNGDFLHSFISAKQASDTLKVSYSAIYKCTSGFIRQQKGYQFSLIKVEKMKKLIMCKKGIALRKGVKL